MAKLRFKRVEGDIETDEGEAFAIERIRQFLESKPPSTNVLDLSGLGLQKVPELLRECLGIEHLDLSSNLIEKIPLWFGDFERLRSLNLNNNNLTELPPELASTELGSLWVENNFLEDIPVNFINPVSSPYFSASLI